MNLLEETIKDLNDYGYTEKDIVFIGSLESGHSCTWDEFKEMANHYYDQSFGLQRVCNDIVILFKDNRYLYRCEYDGSEWWEISKKIVIPSEKKPIKRLFINYKDYHGKNLEAANIIK